MEINDLLDAIMLEESEPSHEALTRWREKFPEHRDRLASFFAIWAIQKHQPKQTEVDEEKIASRLVSHARNIMRNQATD